MTIVRSIPAPSGTRAWLVASLAAAVIAFATVAPAFAARGPVRLADPTVSPVQVTAGQSVTFSVKYSNGQGNGPASIVVKVGSAVYPMSEPPGSANYGGGVVFTAKAAPPVGTWTVEFMATDKFGNVASLPGGTLTVLAPPPPPPPPAGGSSGGSSSGSGAGGSSGGSGGSSGGGSSVGGAPSGGSTGSTGGTTGSNSGSGGSSVGTGGAAGTGGSNAGAGSVASSGANQDDILPPRRASLQAPATVLDAGSVAPGGAAPAGRSVDERSSSGGPSVGAGSAAGAALGSAIPGLGGGLPLDQLLSTAVVTLGGVAMAMSFLLFGRRRRDDDPTDTDEALAEAAASGAGVVSSGSLLGGLGGRPVVAPVAVAPADPEMNMPRWRRPSLLAARKEDPLRMVRSDVKLSFDHGAVAPLEGRERRVIRYRLVRLLDSPDEFVAGEVGLLDEGDEVQLLQRSGAYWLVLSPDGRQGWVHRMVLGDAVEDEMPAVPSGRSGRRVLQGEPTEGGDLGAVGLRASAEGPTAWSLQGPPATDAGMDVDDDVLRAYLASRAKG